MLRTIAIILILILLMAALSAGAWSTSFVGKLCRELKPVAAFFLYLGLGYFIGIKLDDLNGSRVFIVLSLIAHLLLYSTPFIVGYYEASEVLAKSMTKERGEDISLAQGTESLDMFLEKDTGFQGIPAYAVYSERRSLASANIKQYAAKQFEDVDDLGPLLAALLNIVLYTIPMGLKWLLTDTLSIVDDPGYIGLIFWYLVTLGFFAFGFMKGQE